MNNAIFVYHSSRNCIGDVMVRVLAMSAVDRGFEPRSDQTKELIKLLFAAPPLTTLH